MKRPEQKNVLLRRKLWVRLAAAVEDARCSLTTTETLVLGVASLKTHFEGCEMGIGAENGCKCGDNCTCNPCNCK
ncbi:hypothetical protein GQ457_02G041770 [Hibiscus cannabinus]